MMTEHIKDVARVHTVVHRTGHRYLVTPGSFGIHGDTVTFKARRSGKPTYPLQYDLVTLAVEDISAILEAE
jgi:hypothetical protein